MTLTPTEAFVLALGAMAIGIVLLVRGGNWTIDGAVFIAKKHGLSPMVVGFTIVAFGTSLPEMIVSVLANLQGSAGIALGNVLGSNIANILLVVGVAAIMAPLAAMRSKALFKDLSVMMLATVLLAYLLTQGSVARLAGLGMIIFLLGYVFLQYRMALKGERKVEVDENPQFPSQMAAIGALLLGLIAISLGAEFLVRGAKVSASVIGVPEAVVALSIVALGTSLPELSTCIIAVRKGHGDIVLGNVIGSNVFNILMIIGVTALVKPIAHGSFDIQLAEFDIWVVLGLSALFTAFLLIFQKIPRPIGIIFVFGYLVYNLYIYAIYLSEVAPAAQLGLQ